MLSHHHAVLTPAQFAAPDSVTRLALCLLMVRFLSLVMFFYSTRWCITETS